MKTRLRTIIAGLFGLTVAVAASNPRFDDYRTGDIFKGKPAEPVLRTAVQKKFATQIRRQSVLPANFAGHYRVADWGCGSSCVSIALIDLTTGNVYEGPFSTLGYGPAYRYEGGSEELEYRVSSKLLIVRGCPEDKNCGTYYYEWKGDRFNQLRYMPHGPLP
ncbi:MAG TPA: hypothetical protein VG273_22715 [Bryobacteraceae bacterium]|jgi:hypothetical protein|nr:hypothetical protein [Bryobacteraceae bacterium]